MLPKIKLRVHTPNLPTWWLTRVFYHSSLLFEEGRDRLLIHGIKPTDLNKRVQKIIINGRNPAVLRVRPKQNVDYDYDDIGIWEEF